MAKNELRSYAGTSDRVELLARDLYVRAVVGNTSRTPQGIAEKCFVDATAFYEVADSKRESVTAAA